MSEYEHGFYAVGKFVGLQMRDNSEYVDVYVRAGGSERFAAERLTAKATDENVMAALRSLTEGDVAQFAITAPRVMTPRSGAGRSWLGGLTILKVVPLSAKGA